MPLACAVQEPSKEFAVWWGGHSFPEIPALVPGALSPRLRKGTRSAPWPPGTAVTMSRFAGAGRG